jgi:catechol-2,3-dioxygenase
MNARLAIVSLWSDDVVKTALFYRDVIGLSPSHHHSDGTHFDLGGFFLVILRGHPDKPLETNSERFPRLAFSVNNLEAAISELKAHQIELPWGIEHNENSRWVMFFDPGGNLIELVQFEN